MVIYGTGACVTALAHMIKSLPALKIYWHLAALRKLALTLLIRVKSWYNITIKSNKPNEMYCYCCCCGAKSLEKPQIFLQNISRKIAGSLKKGTIVAICERVMEYDQTLLIFNVHLFHKVSLLIPYLHQKLHSNYSFMILQFCSS